MSELPLAGRHALVGGSSKGIGRATAERLARDGASVTLLARSADVLETVRAGLARPLGPARQTHHALALDQNDVEAVVARVVSHVQEAGPIDIYVHNSGGPPGGPIVEASAQAFRDAFERHVVLAQRLAQTLLPAMRDAGFGRFVNVISTSVKEPIAGLGVSNTIRWAVASWAKTWSREVAPFGVTVNNVLPGYTDTDRLGQLAAGRADRQDTTPEAIYKQWVGAVPAGRLGKPEEVAAAVAFLVGPDAAYVTGINIPVDGGRLGSL